MNNYFVYLLASETAVYVGVSNCSRSYYSPLKYFLKCYQEDSLKYSAVCEHYLEGNDMTFIKTKHRGLSRDNAFKAAKKLKLKSPVTVLNPEKNK
jgi:hypothetical protein